MKVEGKVFFVTGGASGLGLATIQALVSRGAFVTCLDLNEDEGHKLTELYKTVVIFVKVDVREEDDILKAIKETNENWPKKNIGGVINCGGIGMAGKIVQRDGTPFSLAVFRQVMDINLAGTFNVSRLITSRIVQQPASSKPDRPPGGGKENEEEDKGVVILVSSTSYQDGQVGQVAYAASKGGVAAMALPMARDLAPFGIRVVCIAPSLFTTSMGKGTSDKVKESLLRSTEFPHRFGQPDEFADLVIHCIENSYLNGTVIRLDGATRMGKI